MYLKDGAHVYVFDPNAIESVYIHTDAGGFHSCRTADEAVCNTHGIVVLTEWDEFKLYRYTDFYKAMLKPAFIFDVSEKQEGHGELSRTGFAVHPMLVDHFKKPSSDLTNLILSSLNNHVINKKIAVLGFAFDLNESPALEVVENPIAEWGRCVCLRPFADSAKETRLLMSTGAKTT